MEEKLFDAMLSSEIAGNITSLTFMFAGGMAGSESGNKSVIYIYIY